MTVDKQQLVKLIELCWAAASEAKITGDTPMKMSDGVLIRTQQDGTTLVVPDPAWNSVRLTVFYNLLNNLIPKNMQGNMHVEEPKEPWQD